MSEVIPVVRDDGTVSKLDLYRRLCRRILEGDKSKRIENERACYAQIIIQELIRSAKCSVDIFCQGDEDCFFEGFITFVEMNAASDERGVKFRVISVHPMKQSLKLLFKRHDADIFEPKTDCDFLKDFFFVVVDGKSFHLAQDLPRHSGFAYANNREFAEELQHVFDKMLKYCNKVQ